MNGHEAIAADHAIEFVQCSSERGFTADVVACGEHMRSIQANT